jgi:hypothetical protein
MKKTQREAGVSVGAEAEKALFSIVLATFLTSLALPIVIALTTDAAAQTRGRGSGNVGCPKVVT